MSRIVADLIWEGQEMGRRAGGIVVTTEDTTRKAAASFVRDVTTDPDKAAILVATITLAHNLCLRVVAEGVQTRENSSTD